MEGGKNKPSRKRVAREATPETAVDETLPRMELTAAETARDYIARMSSALTESNDLEAAMITLRCVGKLDALVRKRGNKK